VWTACTSHQRLALAPKPRAGSLGWLGPEPVSRRPTDEPFGLFDPEQLPGSVRRRGRSVRAVCNVMGRARNTRDVCAVICVCQKVCVSVAATCALQLVRSNCPRTTASSSLVHQQRQAACVRDMAPLRRCKRTLSDAPTHVVLVIAHNGRVGEEACNGFRQPVTGGVCHQLRGLATRPDRHLAKLKSQ
jgi:hypothetical protein